MPFGDAEYLAAVQAHKAEGRRLQAIRTTALADSLTAKIDALTAERAQLATALTWITNNAPAGAVRTTVLDTLSDARALKARQIDQLTRQRDSLLAA